MEKKNNLLKIASYILIAFAAIALVVSVVNIFRTLGPVSYTHLDVYKRQE